MPELLAWLKAKPSAPTAGTAGAGSGSHIAGLYFENATGIKLQFVPYRGTAPALTDLVAGQIDIINRPDVEFDQPDFGPARSAHMQ